MSVAVSSPVASSHKSHREHKHTSERSERKKRKRDEENQGDGSTSKKHRKSKIHETITIEDTESQPIKTTEIKPKQLDSPFHLQEASLYLPLSPISYSYPLEGICAEHLTPLLLTYYPPFKGVVISYSSPRLSESPLQTSDSNDAPVLAKSVDEYAASFVWVITEFLIFRPQRNRWIEGYINLQSESHIGLVCWNLFNASIERKRIPKQWKWVDSIEEDGEGYFVDKKGKKIEGFLRFGVVDCETVRDRDKSFLSIEGTLLEDEKALPRRPKHKSHHRNR